MSSDTLNKFLTTTVGRDRTNRLIQYLCKLLIALSSSPETLGKLKSLQSQVSNTRKVMRILRQLEFYKNAQKAAKIEDDVVRMTLIVKNAGLGLWGLHDTIGWLHSAKLINLNDPKTNANRGYRYWQIALVASLLHNLHKLRLNSIQTQMEGKYYKASFKQDAKSEIEVSKNILQSLKEYFNSINSSEKFKLYFSIVQDSLDLIIPASLSEAINVDPGLVGLIGVITSLMGGWTHWKSL